MADELNEIKISITLDDGSVREGFARIQKSGEDSGKGLSDAFSEIKKTLLEVAAAYIGFEAGKRFIEESIEAASAYDKALNDMNKSLASAGGYTKEASQQFVDLAESVEKSTTLDAKKVLGLEALANNYAHTNEQAIALTKAAIDLGAATGKGPEVALQQLGATLSGTSGRLAKLLPQLKSLTAYQLETGAAIKIVADRFRDAAAGDINTFQGSIDRLGNTFERLKINLGELVTQSPTVRGVIQFLTTELGHLADSLKGLGGNDSFMRQLIIDSIEFGQAFNQAVIGPIYAFYEIVNTVFHGVETIITGTLYSIAGVAAKITSFMGKSFEPLSDSLKNFSEQSKIAMNDFADETIGAFEKIGDSHFTDVIGGELNKLRTVVENAKPFDQFQADIRNTRKELLAAAFDANTTRTAFQDMGNGIYSAVADMVVHSSQLMQQLGATAIKSLGGGMAQAMAAVGKAVVQGKDLFKAFAGAMISALGSALIQMGAGYIMLGLAREIASYGLDPTGYELIGIGGGMAALGGVLEAVGSGVSSSGGSSAGAGATGGAGGGGNFSGGAIAANPANQVTGQQAAVTVNIHGSVFDSQETALRIVDLVNQAFTTQGATVLVK